MIRNIVFDMGNVLITYRPMEVCNEFTNSQEDALLINKELFGGAEWKLLDRGTIEEGEALEGVLTRIPDCLHNSVKQCFMNWHEFMPPIQGMADIIKELKEKGYEIYLCSNASLRFWSYKNRIPGIEFFSGILISAEEKYVKPERELYLRLFQKFQIRPEESFFIDDLEANILGAKHCGMDGYCFLDRNTIKLRKRLENL